MDSIYATPSTMYNNHDVQIRLKAVCRSNVQQYIGGLKCRLFTGVAVSQRMHIGGKANSTYELYGNSICLNKHIACYEDV